jgi:putative endonuclease
MFTVYVLYSDQHDVHYVGYTSNLAERFRSHNELATTGWTVRYRPWRILYTEACSSKSAAMAREKWFKTGVGREFVKTLPH